MGRIAELDTPRIISNTRGSKSAGLVPTCVAISPTCSFTESNRPERLDIIAPAKIPLIQSAIALSTVSKGCHLPLEEMVDKGLEHIEQEDNVGENFHRVHPFYYNKVRRKPYRNRPGHLFLGCRLPRRG